MLSQMWGHFFWIKFYQCNIKQATAQLWLILLSYNSINKNLISPDISDTMWTQFLLCQRKLFQLKPKQNQALDFYVWNISTIQNKLADKNVAFLVPGKKKKKVSKTKILQKWVGMKICSWFSQYFKDTSFPNMSLISRCHMSNKSVITHI